MKRLHRLTDYERVEDWVELFDGFSFHLNGNEYCTVRKIRGYWYAIREIFKCKRVIYIGNNARVTTDNLIHATIALSLLRQEDFLEAKKKMPWLARK